MGMIVQSEIPQLLQIDDQASVGLSRGSEVLHANSNEAHPSFDREQSGRQVHSLSSVLTKSNMFPAMLPIYVRS
jgi:hypothetical protein